ncbi:MAG TPA: hypothetical protein VKR52_15775 [Terracidiphilus sp.]|nr:hypothetical protein [Terracidiphilus sp.]
MRKRSLWWSAAAALTVAVALAGCGSTTYFAGRQLPPSGLPNRVLIAVQNSSALTKGALVFVDAFYDIRYAYNNINKRFSISGYSGALPLTIQNMPEEQIGAVYGYGDGSYSLINYQKESSGTSFGTSQLAGLSASIFVSRNGQYVFAASQSAHILSVIDSSGGGAATYGLSLPGVYRVSVNPGGSVALAFVENSNYMYYPVKLTAQQTLAYSGGPGTWPSAAVDCEPQNGPRWCLIQAQSPDGTPLTFDRPVKAVFSADGGTAYILSCGPECGGSAASVTPLSVAPMIFLQGQQSGQLPSAAALASSMIPVPGGASNALIDSSTMYVVGQQLQADGLFGGNLTVINLGNNTVTSSTPISDGQPGARSRMILADDNTLWIGMTKCDNGYRAANDQPYGCLTMYNTANNSVTMIEPYLGDATGIADVEGLHKVYVAEGGQIYIYSTKDGSSINNQYVTVTGTASDVAYMDATTDGNNTVY